MNLGSLDQVIHLVLGFFKEWKIKQQCQVSSGEPQQQMSGTFHKETLVGPITSTCIWGGKFSWKKGMDKFIKLVIMSTNLVNGTLEKEKETAAVLSADQIGTEVLPLALFLP